MAATQPADQRVPRVGVRRSGSTDTITSADMSLRKDGVNALSVMAISTLWPKPPRWPIQPGTVDPGGRWVWHTRPRFILPLWEHASAGAAQRYVRLAQTRRTARRGS